ncbi:MAG: site-specific tyrosine recombinase/integron integrase [Bacteroidia bacterium]
MEIIDVKPIRHGNENRYFLFYKFSSELNQLVRGVQGARYSNSYRAWHVPANSLSVDALLSAFKNKAWLNLEGITKNALVISNTPSLEKRDNVFKEEQTKTVLPALNECAATKVEEFRRWLKSGRYSQSTINTYIDAIIIFLRFFNHKTIDEINNNDLVAFNNDYILKNNCSASYQNQVINAVKLFFRINESRKLSPELIYRPKRPKLLPNVLSKEEVKLLLNAPANIKHKAMLSLIYACGLRCGELLKLKPQHVDVNRGLLVIVQAKGRKDRVVPLSRRANELIREYLKNFKPTTFLFEGQVRGEMYDSRSLQSVLKQSLEKTGIKKPVTLHWLRHSYATHLLENGTDLRYIQEILGHSSSRTTEIYTHVSTKNIQQITSPFDYL